MTTPPGDARSPAAPAASPFALLGLLVLVLGLLALFGWLELRRSIESLRSVVDEQTRLLSTIEGEVTRFRLEQSAEGKGVFALIEKLSVYAPLLATSRTTKPDYENAKSEMNSIMRAFESLGKDAYPDVLAEFLKIPPGQKFDTRRFLLEATCRTDPERGKQVVKQVLRGYDPEVPVDARIRWHAARMMLRLDKPLARVLLYDILNTESAVGINPARMPGGTAPAVMDAGASSGFHNFVALFIDSEHPQTEEMLIMLLGRSEHDLITKQNCVKALGDRRSRRAVDAIRKAYQNPPGYSQNALFLNHCLDALDKILGAEACGFFQDMLPKAQHELVKQRLQALVKKHNCAAVTRPEQPKKGK